MKANPLIAWLAFPFFISLLIGYGIWFSSVETPPWHNLPSTEKIPAKRVERSKKLTSTEDFQPFSFVSYNVKNWLKCPQIPEKTQSSKAAVIQLLAKAKPDILGLSEIGSQKDITEIQAMLRASGLDLPYYHHTGGIDPVRHLAILSRYPIQNIRQPEILLVKKGQSMQRGILDVTISIGAQSIRCIGLHLKSKRIVSDLDEAELRLSEATHVRHYIDGILTNDPDSMLLVYGDWNDDPDSLSTRTLLGNYRTPLYLTPLSIRDSRGEKWTFHHEAQDSYSRIDYVAVSGKLKRYFNRDQSRILDDACWNLASDHRALFISLQ